MAQAEFAAVAPAAAAVAQALVTLPAEEELVGRREPFHVSRARRQRLKHGRSRPYAVAVALDNR